MLESDAMGEEPAWNPNDPSQLPAPPMADADPPMVQQWPAMQPPAPPAWLAYLTPGPPKPRVWTVYVAWLAAFGGMMASGVLMGVGVGIYTAATHKNVDQIQEKFHDFIFSFWGLIWLFVGNLCSTGSASLGAAALSPTPLKKRLAIAWPAIGWTSILALAVATTATGHFESTAVQLLGIPVKGEMGQLFEALSQLSTAQQAAMVVMIGVLVPITEELLFRGYIQTRLVQRHGAAAGIVITSLLFGVMHADVYQSPMTAVLGLVLGFAAYYGKSLFPAIAAHMLNNTLAVVLTLGGTDEGTVSRPALVCWMAGSACLVGLCLAWTLWRGRKTPANAGATDGDSSPAPVD